MTSPLSAVVTTIHGIAGTDLAQLYLVIEHPDGLLSRRRTVANAAKYTVGQTVTFYPNGSTHPSGRKVRAGIIRDHYSHGEIEPA